MSILDIANGIKQDVINIGNAINGKGGNVTGKTLNLYANEVANLPMQQVGEWYENYVKALHDSQPALTSFGKVSAIIRADATTVVLPSGFYYRLSDGTEYTDGVQHTHMFTGGLITNEIIPFRWVVYSPISPQSGAVNTIPSLGKAIIAVVSEIPYTGSLEYSSSGASINYNYCNNEGLRYIYFKTHQISIGAEVFNTSGINNNLYKIEADEPLIMTGVRPFGTYGCLTYLPKIGGITNNQGLYGYLACRFIEFTFTTSPIAFTSSTLYAARELQWLKIPQNFNVNGLNLQYSIYMSKEALVYIAGQLKDLSAEASKSIVLGATLLAKLDANDIAIFTNKNWVVT